MDDAWVALQGLVQRGRRQHGSGPAVDPGAQRADGPSRSAGKRKKRRRRQQAGFQQSESLYRQLEEAEHCGRRSSISLQQPQQQRPESLYDFGGDDHADGIHPAPPPPPSQHQRLPPEVLRHFMRRGGLLPQGAWPLQPHTRAAPTQPAMLPVRRPPPDDAAPESGAHPMEGVLHLVPRVRPHHAADPSSSSSASTTSTIEWLPAQNLLQSVEVQPYPVPAPPIARLLDSAMARVFGGGPPSEGSSSPSSSSSSSSGAVAAEQEEEGAEGLSITLGELAKPYPPSPPPSPPPPPPPPSSSADEHGGDNEGERRQRREEAWRAARQCVGREAERLVDALLGEVLTCWGERVAAHRGAEPGYVEAVAGGAERAEEKRRRRRVGEWRDDVLGDWASVLQAVELKAGERAALEAEQEQEERRRARMSQAARKRERVNAHRRFVRAVAREKEKEGEGVKVSKAKAGKGKGRGKVGDGGEEEEAEEEVRTQPLSTEWEVLAPVLDPSVRARARARSEALLVRR